MGRQTLFFASLAAVLTIGCPGAREPALVREAPDQARAPARVSSSGIGFRLANADEKVEARVERAVAEGVPLAVAEAARIFGRLPALEEEAEDALDFSMREGSIPPPRPGITIEEKFPPAMKGPPAEETTPTGPLTVERFAPEGEVPLAPKVSLTFSEPMVPITSLGALSEEEVPARISPETPGTWSWLGTRTLVFQPAKRMPMATSFTVTVPAGAKAMSGQTLAREVRWGFRTPPPTLERLVPGGSSVGLEPVIVATFNQAIDPAVMLDTVRVTAGDQRVPVRLATQEEIDKDEVARRLVQQTADGRWVAIRPTRRLPNETQVEVRIPKGAVGAEGPLRSAEEQGYGFQTFGPLKLQTWSCGWRGLCLPRSSLDLTFSSDLDLSRFAPEKVTVSPEIPGMKIDVEGRRIRLSGRTKGRTAYTVRVDAGIADVHGQTLAEPATATLEMGPAPSRVFSTGQQITVLDPAGPAQYTIHSVNESALRVRVYAVSPEDWKAFDSWNDDSESRREEMPAGRLVRDEIVHPREDPDELVATTIDLAPFLEEGLGHLVVQVVPAREIEESERRPELAVWVQATKLGLHAFLEPDFATAWVTRLIDGTPLDGVELSLFGDGSSATTEGGLATLPLTTKGYLLLAKHGKDTAFLTGELYYSGAFVGWRERERASWFLFDDRGMYRPGEEVRIKGWVRSSDLTRGGDLSLVERNLLREGIQYQVKDRRRAELTSGTVEVDDRGGFDFSFTLPSNVNLGQALVELELVDSRRHGKGFHLFQIEEFRKPEYEVRTSVTEGPYFAGTQAVATVSASYYAGGALPDAPVKWEVSQTSASFTPPRRNDYHFGPARRWFWGSRRDEGNAKRESWSAITDVRGEHRLRLSFDALEPSYPFSLALNSTVEDLNRQRWTSRTSMLVHPSDRYVGLRLEKNFVRAKEELNVDLVVADLEGALVAGRPVEVRSARIETTRRGMKSVQAEVDVQRCSVESTADELPIRCTLPTTEGGLYRVTAVVEDEQGRKNQSSMEVWVLGGDGPARAALDAEKVTVVPDKDEYRPGETATVVVISPFVPAQGVLTVRRQGVVHLERFVMEESSQTLQVELDDSMVPSVDLAVDLVGASMREGANGAPDPSLPPRPAYASGSARVKILPSTRTLSVKATPAAPKLSPGGSTTIQVEVRDPSGRPAKDAQVAVFVVDEAVLALSGYETPDPLAAFYSSRAGAVSSLESRRLVTLADLEPEKIQLDSDSPGIGGLGSRGAGGGGLGLGGRGTRGGGRRANQPPELSSFLDALDDGTPIELRKDFSSLALFAPKVRTDARGRASVPLKLPDNLTRYRVMAVAAAESNYFGSTEETITARLPLMVRPSAPRFLNFGDTFDLSVVIQNQTDAAVETAVVARATNLAIDDAARRVTVPANDRVEVRFPASTVKAGTARFQFGVAAQGFSDASQIELPVYTPATTEAFATYGELDEGAIAQPFRMPEAVFTQFGGLEVSTSSTQLQALTDAVIYLSQYPFFCAEQVASRVMGIAALRDVLSAFQAEGLPSPDALQASMAEDLDHLAEAQRPNGGWAFWKGQSETWPYTSIHAAHALVRAKEKGYLPKAETMDRAMSYLRDIEAHIPGWYGADARRSMVAYSLYVRWRNGDADPAKARQLIEEAGGVEALPLEALGWIWPSLPGGGSGIDDPTRAAILRHLGNRTTETAGAAHFVTTYGDDDWVILHSSRRTDGVLLDALISEAPDSSLIPKLVKGLLAHRKAGRWSNTQENAFILLALDRYFATYEKATPDFVARVWLGDHFAGEQTFRGRSTEQRELRVPMTWLATNASGTRDLVLGKEGPGRLYYRLGMRYAPTDLELPPLDRGFEVTRTYEGVDDPDDVQRGEDGSWRVRLGARVRVKVSMVAPSRRYHVALVDPMPAGFEALNPALAVTGEIPKDPDARVDGGRGGRRWSWLWSRSWYEHQNLRDERAEAFTSLLYGGVYDYSYVATATTPGSFVVPPPKAEEMYAPETFGRGAQDRVIVQ